MAALHFAMSSRMSKENRFLTVVVLAALALRLFRIGTQSLWIDEIFTINVSNPHGDLNIWDYLKYNIHGPLHSFVVYLFHFVSMNDGWLRVPSALAGAGAVFFLFRWVASWVNVRVARVAAVLLAIDPLHIYYSQEVRNYSFLLFFGLLATYYLHRLLTNDSRRNLCFYTLAITATVLCNFTGAFLYLTHALIFLVRRGGAPAFRRRVAQWAIVSVAIAILMSPWIYRVYVVIDFGKLATPVMPGQLDTTERLRGETTVSAAAVPYALYVFSTGFSLGPSLRELHDDVSMGTVLRRHGVTVLWVAALFGFLALAGVRRLLLAAGPWRQMLLYLLLPFALTLALNWQNAKAFNVRYVLVALPAWVCLIAAGIDSLAAWRRQVFLFVVAGTLGLSLGNLYFNPDYHREDVRGAVRVVEQDIAPGDCVIAPTIFEVFEHYFTKDNPVHPVFAAPRVSKESVDAQLADAVADCSNVWYVRARPWVNDPDGYLVDTLDARCSRLQLIELEGVEIYRYASGHSHH